MSVVEDSKFPDGKLNEHDEGQVSLAICTENKNVKIMFPKPVAWFGLPPKQAVEFANLIIKRAIEIDPSCVQ